MQAPFVQSDCYLCSADHVIGAGSDSEQSHTMEAGCGGHPHAQMAPSPALTPAAPRTRSIHPTPAAVTPADPYPTSTHAAIPLPSHSQTSHPCCPPAHAALITAALYTQLSPLLTLTPAAVTPVAHHPNLTPAALTPASSTLPPHPQFSPLLLPSHAHTSHPSCPTPAAPTLQLSTLLPHTPSPHPQLSPLLPPNPNPLPHNTKRHLLLPGHIETPWLGPIEKCQLDLKTDTGRVP